MAASVDYEGGIAGGRIVEEMNIRKALSDGKYRVRASAGVIGKEDFVENHKILWHPGIVRNPRTEEIQRSRRVDRIGRAAARVEDDAAKPRRGRNQEIVYC